MFTHKYIREPDVIPMVVDDPKFNMINTGKYVREPDVIPMDVDKIYRNQNKTAPRFK